MNSTLSFKEKYNVLGSKDTSYDGIFITAVKTTGIFCRPSCRARTPKIENVIFYNTVQEAIQNGFRPCKVCKPMEQNGSIPSYIKDILKELQDNPQTKIGDRTLRQRGVEPHTIRRWFKKHYNMTFHSFQRMLKINDAFTNIKNGKSITQSAFGSGYDSLSGFNESYRSVFGDSASKTKNKTIVNIVRFSTPIGAMFACATEKGICLLEFTDEKRLEKLLEDIQQKLSAVILPGKNKYLNQVQKELEEYFDGTRKEFSVPLDIQGTDFRKLVWQELLNIPYGVTRTYKEQSIAMNKLKAIRAVASANGKNKIGIIIPCHRVIGSDGSLTGYGGGMHRKKWLLDFEKSNLPIDEQALQEPIQQELDF